jgi:hypothetical protein
VFRESRTKKIILHRGQGSATEQSRESLARHRGPYLQQLQTMGSPPCALIISNHLVRIAMLCR